MRPMELLIERCPTIGCLCHYPAMQDDPEPDWIDAEYGLMAIVLSGAIGGLRALWG